ncbi:hypothetical protein GALL_510790 [mine drainage metagenome]|uniref:Uncharacterized protein n=1 Tax=mine drainage metagenome TaxID=410659 RepID=A0A1J5PHR9_9ZZZZ
MHHGLATTFERPGISHIGHEHIAKTALRHRFNKGRSASSGSFVVGSDHGKTLATFADQEPGHVMTNIRVGKANQHVNRRRCQIPGFHDRYARSQQPRAAFA